MSSREITLFLFLAVLFALTHQFAVTASLYWYFWWFDILMHFWGGVLIVFGVHIFSHFSFVKYIPNLRLIVITLIIVTGTWELFEWIIGLYEPVSYLRDTAKDLVVGLCGGLLTHVVIKRYTMN
jgi:hypothetical protein